MPGLPPKPQLRLDRAAFNPMNRQEYLEWAKAQAIEYLDRGEISMAITSILSDLSKERELIGYTPENLKAMAAISIPLLIGSPTPEQARYFIDGFN